MLESRHLVGLFLLLVVIFGVVFTLGYLMGRSQFDPKLRATVGSPPGSEAPPAPAASSGAKSKAKQEPEDAQVPKKSSDWDFYHSADPQASADHLQPPPKLAPTPAPAKPATAPKPATVTASKSAAKPEKPSAGAGDPLIPRGAIMLQVAAVLHQDDALALGASPAAEKIPRDGPPAQRRQILSRASRPVCEQRGRHQWPQGPGSEWVQVDRQTVKCFTVDNGSLCQSAGQFPIAVPTDQLGQSRKK